MDQKVYGDWYFALFFDAGDTSSRIIPNFARGLGVGISRDTPVGTLALTVTQALDKPGQPRIVQFTMGPEI